LTAKWIGHQKHDGYILPMVLGLLSIMSLMAAMLVQQSSSKALSDQLRAASEAEMYSCANALIYEVQSRLVSLGFLDSSIVLINETMQLTDLVEDCSHRVIEFQAGNQSSGGKLVVTSAVSDSRWISNLFYEADGSIYFAISHVPK
jgi:hypothetical protein